MEGLHLDFLRSILGLPKHGIPSYITYAEFGRYPLHIFWWKQVLLYRSRLMDMPRERLLSRTFEVNKYITRNSWSTHVDHWLDAHAASHARFTGCMPDAAYTNQVDSSELILRCKTEHEIGMRAHNGSKIITYTHLKIGYNFEDYLSSMTNCQLRKTLSRFRCGSHWLRCATRFTTSTPEEQFCPACLEGRLDGEHETEQHAVFEFDAYYHIRRSQKLRPLFANIQEHTLRAFYEANDCSLIAKFLLHCRRERSKIVKYNDLDIRT